MFDITVLTDLRYVNPTEINDYVQNVLTEDQLVCDALRNVGFKVQRLAWDDNDFDWSQTKYVLFRTTWDYFDRFPEFSKWLSAIESKTTLINPKELIYWNIDKSYLKDLRDAGINIPETIFIQIGETKSLEEIVNETDWEEYILKPNVSGAARHTYRFKKEEASKHNEIFKELIKNEAMMLQEFQFNVLEKGEVAHMMFNGQYSHSILKKSKPGDFRVQDDFGGSVHPYTANADEIEFAEKCLKACPTFPAYARVDVIWDNNNQPCLGELELIEPELWFRMDDQAANRLAQALKQSID